MSNWISQLAFSMVRRVKIIEVAAMATTMNRLVIKGQTPLMLKSLSLKASMALPMIRGPSVVKKPESMSAANPTRY